MKAEIAAELAPAVNSSSRSCWAIARQRKTSCRREGDVDREDRPYLPKMLHHVRRGQGPPLVLVHGLGGRWQSWQPLIPGLAAVHEVVCVDLPGHGETKPLDGRLTFDRLVDALRAFLDERKLAQADLLGSSMGARMVLELARRGLGRNVVALDPGGFWNAPEKLVFNASLKASFKLLKALGPVLPALAGSAAGRTALLPQFSARPWAVPKEVALTDLLSIVNTPALFETLEALVESGPQRGGSTNGKVVLGWGRRDRVTLPRQAKAALTAFPQAELHWLEHCGHFPMWDRPDEAVSVVLAATGN